MTESDPRLDELLSAHLDGETTPEEDARLEREPQARARLDELAAARDALASSAPRIDDATREASLARVFATLDREEHTAPSAPSLTPVTELARRRRNPSRFLAAAAGIIAVVLLGGAIGMLAGESGNDDSGGSSAAAEMSTMDDAGQSAPAAAGEQEFGYEDSAGGSTALAPDPAVPNLGSFTDTAHLEAAVRENVLSARAASTASDGDAATAAPMVPGLSSCPEMPEPRSVHSADVEGRFVLVVVPVTTGAEEPVALVIDPQTCTEVRRITQQ